MLNVPISQRMCSLQVFIIIQIHCDFNVAAADQKAQTPQTSSQADSTLLIAATSFGKGLKRRMESPGQPQRPASAGQDQMRSHQTPPPGNHSNTLISHIHGSEIDSFTHQTFILCVI